MVVQVDLPLGRQPAILRLEGAAVQCQLELRAPAGFGFYVFIDTLHIQNTPACSGDFLQFGRWDFTTCFLYDVELVIECECMLILGTLPLFRV